MIHAVRSLSLDSSLTAPSVGRSSVTQGKTSDNTSSDDSLVSGIQ